MNYSYVELEIMLPKKNYLVVMGEIFVLEIQHMIKFLTQDIKKMF